MKNNYLKRNRHAGIIVLLMALLLPLAVVAQVDVHVTILPPYSSKLSDYLSRPQQVLLMVHNSSTTNQNVQLRGEFVGDNGVSIRAGANFKSSTPIRLGPNETRTLGINDVSTLFDINKVTFSGITKSQFISQNGVPEGNYQICIEAYDYYTNKPLSAEAPSGCSNIFPVSNVEDPTVIVPYDEQVVSTAAGQNFIISWSTPSGAPPSTQYTVKIVEIFGNKSPADAFNSSMTPIFFQQTVTGINSLVYGPAMPAMTLGRHYAIAITAADPMNTVTFKNRGQSVISSFVYGDAPIVVSKVKSEAITQVAAPVTSAPIPVNTMLGSINWFFYKSEEEAPSGRTAPGTIFLEPVAGNTSHPLAGATVNLNIYPNYTSAVPGKLPVPKLPPWNPHLSAQQNEDNQASALQDLQDEVWQGGNWTAKTDNNGNFQADVSGVLEAIGRNPPGAMKGLGYGHCESITVVVSNNQVPMDGKWGNDFGLHAITLPLSAFGGSTPINLGSMVALSNTLRFRPVVTDGTGRELKDAIVNVYRRSDHYAAYPYQIYEGNLDANQTNRQQVNIDGVMYTKVASLNSGHTATRLYSNGPSDSYKIQINEGDYTTLGTTLSVNTDTLVGITLQRNYSMASAPTVFAGTVSKNVNGIQVPAAGASVTFINFTTIFSAATDSAGNFSMVNGTSFLPPNFPGPRITTIIPYGTYQPFIVKYNGQTIVDSVLIDKPGKTYNKQVTLNVATYPINGHIVDVDNKPIANPVIRWASTGQAIPTDAQGGFSTSNTVGTDSLIISKLGYADKHYGVTILSDGLVLLKQPAAAPPAPAVHGPFKMIPLRRGPTTVDPVFGANPIINAVNGAIGNLELDKNEGKTYLYIVDNSFRPIKGALVNFDVDPLPQGVVSNADGLVTIVGPAGDLTFDIQGPPGSTYVPMQAALSIAGDGATTTYHIGLQSGVQLSGRVTANGSPVANAVVGMLGQEYGMATTDANGNYTVNEPLGNYAMEASKQGYLAGIKQATYASNQTLNFSLTISSINITKLLGFSVQVDQVKNNGANKLISGEFINIPSNSIFSVAANTKLRFVDVPVTIRSDGTAVPVDGYVQTSEQSINVTAFKYLPLTLSNQNDDNHNDAIYIAERNSNASQGEIMGVIGINFANFIPAGVTPYADDGTIITNNQLVGKNNPIATLTEDGSISGSSVLSFGNGQNPVFNIYGFKLTADFANSSIQKDGIHLAGNINFSNIPVLSGSQFNIGLVINKDGSVGTVSAQPNIKLNIAGWGGQISSLSFNENGFSLGGSLTLQIPATNGNTNVNFSNLQIAKDQLYGGTFTLPQGGLNVFGVANITGSNIGLGKLGNTNVYYLSGGGSIKFNGAAGSYIDPVQLTQFQVQTDGKMAVTASTNISNSFFGGVAKLNVSQISLSDLNDNPQIDIQGGFKFNMPELQATVGGIHIKSGGKVSVDDLGLGFDIAGGTIKIAANVSFENDQNGVGFSGSGGFDIANFATVGTTFFYYKVPGGISVGANVSTSVAIPLGTSGLMITSLNGQFKYNSARDSWLIGFGGHVSVGEGTFTGADIGITVQNGPIIAGWADLAVAGLNVARGDVLIDIPHKMFSVKVTEGVSIPGLSDHASAIMLLSLAPDDKYFLFGMQANSDILGVLNMNAALLVAYNLDLKKHANDYPEYIAAIDPSLRAGRSFFTGISTTASAYETLDNYLPNFDASAVGFGFGIHSHFAMGANGFVTVGTLDRSPTLAVGLNVDWGAWATATIEIADVPITAGVNIKFGAGLGGSFTLNPTHVVLTASGEFFLHIWVGDIDANYCKTGIVLWNKPRHDWASLCLDLNMKLGFDSYNSFPYFKVE